MLSKKWYNITQKLYKRWNMTKEEYEKNIEKLISWAKAYYVDDEPIASDEEYDKLARECLEFENKNQKHYSNDILNELRHQHSRNNPELS